MPELKAASFDCYGTLVDSQGGLAAFLYDLAPRGAAIESRVLQRECRGYREVLEWESLWGLLELVES